MALELRFLDSIDDAGKAELATLYRLVGWIGPEDGDDFLRGVVSGSLLFGAAFDGKRIVGCGRVISDGVSDAYLQDIAVHPDWRRQGVGGRIVRFLTDELRRRGIDWIGLVGVPGTERFYPELGFEAVPGYTFYRLK